MIISDMDCVNAYVNWDITKAEAVLAWGRIKKFIEDSCKKPDNTQNKPCPSCEDFHFLCNIYCRDCGRKL